MNPKEVFADIKKDKKTIIIIFIGVFGIVLLLISNFSTSDNIDSNSSTVDEVSVNHITINEIEKMLEERLAKAVTSVNGAGNAHIMVSLGSTGEYVYAENKQFDADESSSSSDTQIVVFEENDNEHGLVISIKSPEILGVAVICEGGESSVIKAEITRMITSLFGIGADRVYVGAKTK